MHKPPDSVYFSLESLLADIDDLRVDFGLSLSRLTSPSISDDSEEIWKCLDTLDSFDGDNESTAASQSCDSPVWSESSEYDEAEAAHGDGFPSTGRNLNTEQHSLLPQGNKSRSLPSASPARLSPCRSGTSSDQLHDMSELDKNMSGPIFQKEIRNEAHHAIHESVWSKVESTFANMIPASQSETGPVAYIMLVRDEGPFRDRSERRLPGGSFPPSRVTTTGSESTRDVYGIDPQGYKSRRDQEQDIWASVSGLDDYDNALCVQGGLNSQSFKPSFRRSPV
ncbi:hypothetical protein F25303_14065 [Fusarium sp. NRRL 25303]|nr:hypothetical protein F25303_14065 [Fusarium sp. NRRL 25303]